MVNLVGFWTGSLVGLIDLAVYLLTAFAFYRLARLRCVRYPWLAFLPFFSLYIQGYIGDTLKYSCPPFNRYLYDVPLQYVLPLLSIFSSLGWVVPFVGGLVQLVLQLAIFIGQMLVYLFIYQYYEPQRKYLFTILSVIPLVGPLLVLYCTRGYRY